MNSGRVTGKVLTVKYPLPIHEASRHASGVPLAIKGEGYS